MDAELVVQLGVDPRLDHAYERLLGQFWDLVEGRGTNLRHNVCHGVHLFGLDDRRADGLIRRIRELSPLSGFSAKQEKKERIRDETLTKACDKLAPRQAARCLMMIHREGAQGKLVPPDSTTTLNPALTKDATLSGVCETRFSPGYLSLKTPTVSSW